MLVNMRQTKEIAKFFSAEAMAALKPYHEVFARWDRSKVLTGVGCHAIKTIYEWYTKETGDKSVRSSCSCNPCMTTLVASATLIYMDTYEKAAETPIVEAPKQVPAEPKKVQQKPRKRQTKAK